MANVRFDIPATNRLSGLPIEALTRVFAAVLVDRVHHNDRLATKGAITRFHSKQPPPLEISAYLDRLCKYTPFPRDAVLLAVVYLNRITHLPYTAEQGVDPQPLLAVAPPRLPPRPPSAAPRRQAVVRSQPTSPTSATTSGGGGGGGLSPPTSLSPIEAPSPLPPSPTISSVDRPRVAPFLNSYTLHRLVLSVLLIATKFAADGTLSQTRAAKVGGVGANELCKLEGEGLRLLGWELGWSLDEIEGACGELEREAEQRGILPHEAAQRAPVARRADEVRPPGTDPPRRVLGNAPALLPFASPTRPSFLSAPSHHTTRRPSLSTRSSGSTSTSATTTTASSSSEASTSQPSSSASSPQLFIALPHDPAGRRPYAAHHALPSRARGSARAGSQEGTVREGDELTPPSSPSASSVEGVGDGVKAHCGGEGSALGEEGVAQGLGALRLTARPEP
ncbi:hypothetical protein JCM8208_001535 [Rhodotorula glutinis]